MAMLDIDSLTPGMKVGKDVIEASGQVLLRAGTEISEKHLRVFRSWGIQQVEIEGPTPPDSEETFLLRAPPELIDRAHATVTTRFRHTDPTHPAIAELMRLAIRAELRLQLPPAPTPPLA